MNPYCLEIVRNVETCEQSIRFLLTIKDWRSTEHGTAFDRSTASQTISVRLMCNYTRMLTRLWSQRTILCWPLIICWRAGVEYWIQFNLATEKTKHILCMTPKKIHVSTRNQTNSTSIEAETRKTKWKKQVRKNEKTIQIGNVSRTVSERYIN